MRTSRTQLDKHGNVVRWRAPPTPLDRFLFTRFALTGLSERKHKSYLKLVFSRWGGPWMCNEELDTRLAIMWLNIFDHWPLEVLQTNPYERPKAFSP